MQSEPGKFIRLAKTLHMLLHHFRSGHLEKVSSSIRVPALIIGVEEGEWASYALSAPTQLCFNSERCQALRNLMHASADVPASALRQVPNCETINHSFNLCSGSSPCSCRQRWTPKSPQKLSALAFHELSSRLHKSTGYIPSTAAP